MGRVLEQVTRWLPTIEDVRRDLGVTAARYGDATLLALIHVESAGNPDAHRDGSQYYGLLQMGEPAGKDVGFEDKDRETTAHLSGDGYAAIRAFIEYQERYNERTQWIPTRQAVLWKGGPGTAKTLRHRLQGGMSWADAIKHAEEHHRVVNLREYLRRFSEAFQSYAVWLDDRGVPFPRTTPEPNREPGRD